MVEEQCGFRKGRNCIDAIFTVQQIMEKRKEHNLPLFPLFIDYEKAYDNVNRDNGIFEPIYINKGVRQGCGL